MRINIFLRQVILVLMLGFVLFPELGAAAAETIEPGTVSFSLENVEAYSDRTIFQISLQFDRETLWLGSGPWHAQLTDEAGLPYPVIDITPAEMNGMNTKIFRTSSFSGTEALTLSVGIFPYAEGTFSILEEFPMDYAGFLFDPGPDPQVGDVWELDEPLPAGPFMLHVVGASMTAADTLVFEIESMENVTEVMLFNTTPNLAGSSGGPAYHGENIMSEMTFHDIPKEPFTISALRVYYTVAAPAPLAWQPPAATERIAPTLEPTPTIPPYWEPQPTNTPDPDNPYQVEVRELTQKFEAPLRQGAGWIHVVTERQADLSASQNYPPEFIRSEHWYETDDSGLILNEVSMDYDKDDRLLQRSATKGDYTVNYTTGDSGFFGGSKRPFSLDMLSRALADAPAMEGTVSREEVTCEDGGSCLLFTLLYEDIIGMEGNIAFPARGFRVWVDQESGQQFKAQQFNRLPDGGEQMTDTMETVLVEKLPEPPQEILTILERIR